MPSNTREKMLDVAERLFTTYGYDSVRLRDIADELGIKHAALYYHAPDGKSQIYVEVMKRSLKRHRQGMEDALSEAGTDIRQQMQAVASGVDHFGVERMAQIQTFNVVEGLDGEKVRIGGYVLPFDFNRRAAGRNGQCAGCRFSRD